MRLGCPHSMLPFLAVVATIDYAINCVIAQVGMNLRDLRMQFHCGEWPIRSKQVNNGLLKHSCHRAARESQTNQAFLGTTDSQIELRGNIGLCLTISFTQFLSDIAVRFQARSINRCTKRAVFDNVVPNPMNGLFIVDFDPIFIIAIQSTCRQVSRGDNRNSTISDVRLGMKSRQMPESHI